MAECVENGVAYKILRRQMFMSDEIMVSIICLTYNHELYIRKALSGFINQKTDFKFEVIVHDDASTDKTADVIREFERSYPSIIKPIYEKENQFTNGDFIKRQVLKKIKGKYIALCEGDDYWIEPLKLQYQVDILERHPEYSGCFHDAVIIGSNGKVFRNGFFPSNFFKTPAWENKDKEYDFEEMLGFDFIPTASIMTKTSYYADFSNYCENPVCGDIPFKMWIASNGNMYYINKKMSAYRTFNANSASGQIRNNIEKLTKTYYGHVEIYEGFDKSTNGMYHELLVNDLKRRKIWYLMSVKKYRELLTGENRKIMRTSITFTARMKFWMEAILGPFYEKLRAIRNNQYVIGDNR